MEIDLASASIETLQALQRKGTLTAAGLVAAYLERIESLNPAVNAIIELNPDARAIAARLDDERDKGRVRGPLHGIALLIKDNIDTADQMSTTAGSLALAGSIAAHDAFVVTQLREAGAVILGKTNLSEWANMRSSRSSTGWSSRGGQTRNPYALDRSPGGSSSGSGVAVACGMCAAALGTETDGSVVIPSAMNSIVGIKPSLGLVSRTGIIPIAHSQDTAGPMARTVKDAAIVLAAMLGYDLEDPITSQSHSVAFDQLVFDQDALRGIRVGIARTHFGFHDGVDAIVEQAIQALEECGAIIIDDVSLVTSAAIHEFTDQVLLYELKPDLEAYLSRLGPHAPVRSLAEIIDFNHRHADQTMPYFAQEYFLAAQAMNADDGSYQETLEASKRLAREQGIDAALSNHQLDVLFAPTIGAPWMIDLVNGDHRSHSSCTPAAVAGYPSITVPAGYLHGLPVGASFIGGAHKDVELIQYAYAFEQATRVRQTPQTS